MVIAVLSVVQSISSQRRLWRSPITRRIFLPGHHNPDHVQSVLVKRPEPSARSTLMSDWLGSLHMMSVRPSELNLPVYSRAVLDLQRFLVDNFQGLGKP